MLGLTRAAGHSARCGFTGVIEPTRSGWEARLDLPFLDADGHLPRDAVLPEPVEASTNDAELPRNPDP
jgi:hypothetical protein